MNCSKVGKLIFDLRTEKNMTQKELADKMGISDRTISKWERGLGCPDVSILNELSQILEVDIENILNGNLDPNEKDRGNMKRIKFYVCDTCKNIISATGDAGISCCGRKLNALSVNNQPENHSVMVTKIENDYFVSIDHEMSKEHYISFAAYVNYDRVLIIKLYPEQNAELRFPIMRGKKLYLYCNKHGFWEQKL